MVIPRWCAESTLCAENADFRNCSCRNCCLQKTPRDGASREDSERLQVSNEIVFFVIRKHFFVSRHSVAAFVNFFSDVGFCRLLPVVHFFAAEEALQAGSHLLLGAVRVVANGALLEDFLAFFGITLFFFLSG